MKVYAIKHRIALDLPLSLHKVDWISYFWFWMDRVIWILFLFWMDCTFSHILVLVLDELDLLILVLVFWIHWILWISASG